MKNAGKTRASKESYRFLVGLASGIVFSLGMGHLLLGHLEYQNWWGSYVFAPFAIVVGALGLFVAIFAKPAPTMNTLRRSRIRGWPTGRARYYRNR
jgi:hypothetical protein